MQKLLVTILAAGCVLALAGARRAVTMSQGVHHGAAAVGTIEGLVLSPEGQPVAQAVVHAERENFLKGMMPFAKTDAQGKFVITGLEPREYKVYASKEEDGYPRPTSLFHTGGAVVIPQVSVRAGQVTSNVVIHLAPRAASLVGRVTNSTNKKAVKDARITLRRVDNPAYYFMTGPNQRGEFNILIPAAPVTVEVSAPGYDEKRLQAPGLRQGARKRFDISLRPAH